MKPLFFAFTLIALLAATPALAQEGGGLKVTTILHEDGTRTDMQKDFESHTAETKTYDAAKKLIQRATYSIDEQGRLLDGVVYDAKDRVIGRTSNKYDAFGRISDQFEKSPNGALQRHLVYSYAPNGRMLGIDVYDANGNLIQPGTATGSSRKKGRSK